jgi:hypothetical protein
MDAAANIFTLFDGSKRAEMCMHAKMIYGVIASVAMIHLHLLVFAIVPVHLVILGLGLQIVYVGLIRQMPNIKLLAPLSLTAIGTFHHFCFVFFKFQRCELMFLQLACTHKSYAGSFIWG